MSRRTSTSAPLVRPLLALAALAALMAFTAPARAQISGELEGITKDFRPAPVAEAGGCSASASDAAPPLAGLLLLAGLARRRR